MGARKVLVAAIASLMCVAAPARADVFDDNPAAATLNGTTYVFARNGDNRIIERHTVGAAWSAWAPVSGLEAGSGPAALAYGASLLLFARGPDGAVWQNTLRNGGWSGWSSLGGRVTSAPAAGLRRGTATVDLVARGTNNALYHRAFAGGSWSPWTSLGGNIGSAATAAGFNANGAMDLFVRDAAGAVAHRYFANGAWSDWRTAGGRIVGAPASVTPAAGRLDLYVRSPGNALYHHYHDGGTAWTLVDRTPLASSPTATSDAPNRELIFARIGNDLQLKVATVGSAKTPSFGPWTSLGPIGLPGAPPAAPAPPAPTRLTPLLDYTYRPGRRSTRFRRLIVKSVPAGAMVQATCRRGCSRKRLTVNKKRAGSVSLAKLVKRPIRAGRKLVVIVTKPGTIGSHKVLTVRRRRAPSIRTRCLPPGAIAPQSC